MKRMCKLIRPVLLAAILLLAVRGLLVGHLRLPDDMALPGLAPRQHVWLNRISYGLRLPDKELWGYHRWGYQMPALHDELAFVLPGPSPERDGSLCVGICRALPGDTVWIDPVRQRILPGRTSPDAQPIVVPGRGRKVAVTPYNARLLAYMMRHYEQCRVRTDARQRLILDHRAMTSVQTAHDYYWIESLPDSFVLVPHEALMGKIYPMRPRHPQPSKAQ